MSSQPPFDPRPVVLEGDRVRLEPLGLEHAPDLYVAGCDEVVWRHLNGDAFASVADAEAWIATVHAEQAADGERIAFAIVDREHGRTVGTTSYLEIRRPHRTIEIGWTWLGVAAQRSHVNTHCKLLLLTHAFEMLGANRVQFKTDLRNRQSQTAIERIGAVREGVLRRVLVLPDGRHRDSVYYSVIAGEWPGVRARLEAMAERDLE